MTKEYIINLFHNDFLSYTGYKKEFKAHEDGGVVPVVMPIGSFRTAKKFPYRIDRDKNIMSYDIGDYRVSFLIPTKDVSGLSEQELEQSIYYELFGEDSKQEQIDNLEETIESKEDEIGRLKNRLDNATQEEEEEGKSDTGNSANQMLTCSRCGEESSKQNWQRNQGWCPKCQEGNMSEAL